MSKIKLALLSGGISGEREVSIKTGQQIYKALDKDKYEIFQFDPKTDLNTFFNSAAEKKFDIVFPALHGPFGEDGKLQGMLDMLDLKYVFSDCLSSALAMNKHLTKIIADQVGILTIPGIKIKKNDPIDLDKIVDEINLPIVVKPVELGSSVGITIAKTINELKAGIKLGFKFDKELLLEKFIEGREITATVIEKNKNLEALPLIEIIPKASDWFDYKAKYEPGASEEICPANIPDDLRKKTQQVAKIMFQELGCKDLARADFIWTKSDNNIYFLETNTIPGMTATSLAPQAAKAAGMEFGDFLDVLINNNI